MSFGYLCYRRSEMLVQELGPELVKSTRIVAAQRWWSETWRETAGNVPSYRSVSLIVFYVWPPWCSWLSSLDQRNERYQHDSSDLPRQSSQSHGLSNIELEHCRDDLMPRRQHTRRTPCCKDSVRIKEVLRRHQSKRLFLRQLHSMIATRTIEEKKFRINRLPPSFLEWHVPLI